MEARSNFLLLIQLVSLARNNFNSHYPLTTMSYSPIKPSFSQKNRHLSSKLHTTPGITPDIKDRRAIMASEYLSVPPVFQGQTGNYCWAACMEWWLKAVRKYEGYDMDKIIFMFLDYVHDSEDGDSGALTEKGMFRLLNHPSFHMWYEESHSGQIAEEKWDKILAERGPFVTGYTEFNIGTDSEGNALTGFHMNVVVEKNDNLYTVMDPRFTEFQKREIGYYKKGAYKNFYAFSTKLGTTPVYGY